MLVKPNFINIGPGRCGTSWLYEALEAHPQIGMGKVKETEFFNTHYAKGVDWYESHFSHLASRKAIGEVSNNYYLDAQVAQRIRDYNPEIKIIINIRDPFNLLGSVYQFGQRRGLQLPPIEAALAEPVGKFMGSGYDYRLKRNTLTRTDRISLLESVMLSDLIKPFVAVFPENQIYCFIYEKFRQNPEIVLEEIYRFLGVDPDYQPKVATEVVNQSISPRSRFLARYGSRFAFVLRRVGAYRLLSGLHKSRLIKRLFFGPSDRGHRRAEKVTDRLDGETIARLAEEKVRLIELIPELDRYWGRG
jgi:hypothetical protein